MKKCEASDCKSIPNNYQNLDEVSHLIRANVSHMSFFMQLPIGINESLSRSFNRIPY